MSFMFVVRYRMGFKKASFLLNFFARIPYTQNIAQIRLSEALRGPYFELGSLCLKSMGQVKPGMSCPGKS